MSYREVWLLDFEFNFPDGEGGRRNPVCMVAKKLGTAKDDFVELWLDGADPPPAPPFPIGDDVLFVAFAAQAEWGCFIELRWPMPTRIVDLYVEARLASNDTSPKPDKFNALLQGVEPLRDPRVHQRSRRCEKRHAGADPGRRPVHRGGSA